MKVDDIKKEDETDSSPDSSYVVEPGYVKQMIDRFSSGLSNDNINDLASEEASLLFKLPLLHSTKTKMHEPFQYPILLANRSSVPVKSVVNTRGLKNMSESSTSSTCSNGGSSNIWNNNVNSSNLSIKTNNNNTNGTNLNGEMSQSNMRDVSSSRVNNTSTSKPSLHTHNNYTTVNSADSKINNNHNQFSVPSIPASSHLEHTKTNNELNTNLNSLDLNLSSSKTQDIINKENCHIENHIVNKNDMADLKDVAFKEGLDKKESSKEKKNSNQVKDGHFFLSLMATKGKELLQMCDHFQADLNQPSIDEGVMGKIRSAVGKANLLLTKKFKQFDDLCAANLSSAEEEPLHVTCEDLGGFWDMMLLQIDDIEASFQELHSIKLNHWTELPSTQPPLSPTSKHQHSQRSEAIHSSTNASKVSAKSAKMSKGAKARSDRLHAAMVAGRRQRKTSQSDDVVIFVADKTH